MFKGSIVALVTPMKKNGDIDFISLKKLINIHISNGTNAIVIGGTTGEASTLSIPEHYELIEKSIEYSNGKIPIIAGTGSNNTKEAIEWTSEAKRVGSDACLIVTPYYNNPTQEGLYKHFKTIADNVDIPQILYNVPSRTGYSIEIDIVKKLSNHKNIIGIKEASGNLEYCARLLEVFQMIFLFTLAMMQLHLILCFLVVKAIFLSLQIYYLKKWLSYVNLVCVGNTRMLY